jgi:hypothetical protein
VYTMFHIVAHIIVYYEYRSTQNLWFYIIDLTTYK